MALTEGVREASEKKRLKKEGGHQLNFRVRGKCRRNKNT